MNFNKKLILAALSAVTIGTAASCNKDYLETKPTNQVVLEDVFKTTQGARAVINGIHRTLYESTDHDVFGVPSINLKNELMAGDLGMAKIGAGWFVGAFRYNEATDGDSEPWTLYYRVINNANFVINNIESATGPESDKVEIKAQAFALRSWAYFQLIQTYQFAYGAKQYVVTPSNPTAFRGELKEGASTTEALGVPVYTEPTKEGKLRSSMKDVLDRISLDIDSSIHYFQNAGARTDKSQININVAHGIKARFSLYTHNWAAAAEHANLAKEGYTLMSSSELLGGMNNAANGEWIWGSIINQEQNGIYASWMSHMDPRINGYGSMAEKIMNQKLLYNVIGFRYVEATDTRVNWWNPVRGTLIDTRFVRRSQLKFRSRGANSFLADYPLMRAAEMHLIQAEALAMANRTQEAKDVLFGFVATRNSAYEQDSTLDISTKDKLVQEIWRQRRIELWGEGFRLFDAKRQMATFPGVTSLDQINRSEASFPGGVMGNEFNSVASNSPRLLYRIPGSEIVQTPGVYQNP